MSQVADAPWVGYCKEEFDERSAFYDEREEEYLANKADEDCKREQEDRK